MVIIKKGRATGSPSAAISALRQDSSILLDWAAAAVSDWTRCDGHYVLSISTIAIPATVRELLLLPTIHLYNSSLLFFSQSRCSVR